MSCYGLKPDRKVEGRACWVAGVGPMAVVIVE